MHVHSLELFSMTKRKVVRNHVALDSQNIPKIDTIARGVESNLREQFRDRLILEAQLIAEEQGKHVVDASHLQQAYEQLLSIPTPEMWDILNKYRIYLIQKEIAESLTEDEAVELEMLQIEA